MEKKKNEKVDQKDITTKEEIKKVLNFIDTLNVFATLLLLKFKKFLSFCFFFIKNYHENKNSTFLMDDFIFLFVELCSVSFFTFF